MNRKVISLILVSFLICTAILSSAPCACTAAPEINVTGQVLDRDGRAVQLATLTLYYNDTRVDLLGNPTLTDSDGRYLMKKVPPGTYSLEARRNAFSFSSTIVTNDTDVSVNFTLPGSSADMAATPRPEPTCTPAPTAAPTVTPVPPTATQEATPTPMPAPGFEVMATMVCISIVLAIKEFIN